MHDVLAELAAYRDELAHYTATTKTDRAQLVCAEIDRVSTVVRDNADTLDELAQQHDDSGQDMLAAQARVEARRLRAALRDAPETAAESDPPETAAESHPQETAVPRRARRTTKG